jgi:hypothetical protein
MPRNYKCWKKSSGLLIGIDYYPIFALLAVTNIEKVQTSSGQMDLISFVNHLPSLSDPKNEIMIELGRAKLLRSGKQVKQQNSPIVLLYKNKFWTYANRKGGNTVKPHIIYKGNNHFKACISEIKASKEMIRNIPTILKERIDTWANDTVIF